LYAEPRVGLTLDECAFYHVMELPRCGIVGEGFDLRDNVDACVGDFDFDGTRVLEIGPASGFLTFHMERQGGEVVAVELGPDTEWDVVPRRGIDVEALVRDRNVGMESLRNSWWFVRERLGGHARVHYGTGYDLPDQLGRFDVALLANVLLHTRDPLRIIQNCARLVDSALVIVERSFPGLGTAPVARFAPSPDNDIWGTWWDFTPAFFERVVRVLGFESVEVTCHEQRLDRGRDGRPGGPVPFFTLVARR
jgi:O-methyltransferase